MDWSRYATEYSRPSMVLKSSGRSQAQSATRGSTSVFDERTLQLKQTRRQITRSSDDAASPVRLFPRVGISRDVHQRRLSRSKSQIISPEVSLFVCRHLSFEVMPARVLTRRIKSLILLCLHLFAIVNTRAERAAAIANGRPRHLCRGDFLFLWVPPPWKFTVMPIRDIGPRKSASIY